MMVQGARSIRTRLLLALMAMTLLTLAISNGLSALMDHKIFKDHVRRDLEVMAAMVGDSCVSPLVFNSPETATRYLAMLEREYQIQAARIEDATGAVFAQWQRHNPAVAQSAHAHADRQPLWFKAQPIKIDQPLEFDGQPIGRLVLTARLDEVQHQLRQYVVFGGVLALLTLGVALLVALRLQRRIVHPIQQLIDKTREISHRQDLRLRVEVPHSSDELETLASDFNRMLAQIETHEESLRQHGNALDEANAQLRRLAMDLSLLEATERQRLAGELHDSPMQKLALAQLQITASARTECLDDETQQQLEAGLVLLREAIGELRSLQFDLCPPILQQKGLAAALDWLASSTQERWGIQMQCEIATDLPEPGRDASLMLFQCARELVYNLIKHAGASAGALRLTSEAEQIVISVEDNGRGLPANDLQTSSGYGLHSVRERMDLLGGKLELGASDFGARIRILLPISIFSNDLRPAKGPDRHLDRSHGSSSEKESI